MNCQIRNLGDHVHYVCRRYTARPTCEHSHKLTSGLLEFKANGVFTAFMPSTAV